MELGLSGKVALVTGASRGLGRAVAEELAAEGARLVVASRNREVLNAAAAALADSHGSDVFAFPADVSREDEVSALVEAALERFGTVDVLVANAGGPPASRFATTDVAAWKDGIELSLLSTIYLCRAVVPVMKARKSGRIVAITSVSVKEPVPGLILSNTARAGVAGMIKTLSAELAPDGVTANLVCPGYTRTDRLVSLASKMSEQEGVSADAIYARWNDQIPMGRLGEPKELAALVAFLCSERASYVTGSAIAVDGGLLKSML